jgi:hypothetical protein
LTWLKPNTEKPGEPGSPEIRCHNAVTRPEGRA